jgi:hypothetical protein
MIGSRSRQFYVTTGGALAALLPPGVAQAAECGAAAIQQSLPGSPLTFNFPGFTIGLASAIGSTVTTADAALQAQGSSAFVAATPTQAPDQQGGGVWVRAVGGNVLTSVPVAGSSSLSIPPVTATTAIDCQSRVRQGFTGVQVGADVANLNFGGSGGTLHVGLTSGQVETSALTNSTATNLDFQVPFFGLYASLTYGDFFADAQIRGNFFQGSLTDRPNALFGEKVNARGFTASGNIGYHIGLPGVWFIEPSAGVNWSRTFVDLLLGSPLPRLLLLFPFSTFQGCSYKISTISPGVPASESARLSPPGDSFSSLSPPRVSYTNLPTRSGRQ